MHPALHAGPSYSSTIQLKFSYRFILNIVSGRYTSVIRTFTHRFCTLSSLGIPIRSSVLEHSSSPRHWSLQLLSVHVTPLWCPLDSDHDATSMYRDKCVMYCKTKRNTPKTTPLIENPSLATLHQRSTNRLMRARTVQPCLDLRCLCWPEDRTWCSSSRLRRSVQWYSTDHSWRLQEECLTKSFYNRRPVLVPREQFEVKDDDNNNVCNVLMYAGASCGPTI